MPTPNLSSGQCYIHIPLEWVCLDEMVAACVVGVEIVKRWGQQLGLGSAVLDWVVVDELFKKSNSKRLRIELLIHVLIAEQSTTMAAR